MLQDYTQKYCPKVHFPILIPTHLMFGMDFSTLKFSVDTRTVTKSLLRDISGAFRVAKTSSAAMRRVAAAVRAA